MRSRITCLLLILLTVLFANAQSGFKFAHVTDTHIGSATAAEDLSKTIADINAQSDIEFVLITGDITDFGTDAELKTAKQLFDSLQKPWYIVPGNHDAGWSESGANSFAKIFGSETFAFSHKGYRFIGTACGPTLRMGPGQVPHEQIVWLDSTLSHLPDPQMPVIFVNHYPMDSAMTNWYKVMDLLKRYNTQAILCGHWHNNHFLYAEGIPEIVGRSNLRAKQPEGGYNIVTIENGKMSYRERHPGATSEKDWATAVLQKHDFKKDTTIYQRPSYDINKSYPFVQADWKYQDAADIRCGIALAKDLLITANTKGDVYALRQSDGKKMWHFQTSGKVFSTPAIAEGLVTVASTDGNLYCLKAATGRLYWRTSLNGTSVASSLIQNGNVYVGTSNGHFKAFRLKDGKMLWDFAQVNGFVESKAVYSKGRLYFASWGNELYALNATSGQLDWKWTSGAPNRMFSAAGSEPVVVNNKLFIVAPDRFMTSLDASSGKEIWRQHWDSAWVRQSIGISEDSSLIYVKTMQGTLLGIPVAASSSQIAWRSLLNLGYELDPAVIRANNKTIYVPSDKGVVSAVDAIGGNVLWQYKIAHSQLNTVVPANDNRLFVTSADGAIYCLRAHKSSGTAVLMR